MGRVGQGSSSPDVSPGRNAADQVIAGRFRILEPLGSGGFGEVHRAHDRITGEDVAVKLLPADLPVERMPLIRREIAALRMLRFPGIVRLLDEGMHEKRPFLAMELVTGSPFPGKGARHPSEVVGRAAALLEALGRVHAIGILHRDLKPSNVLVDSFGRPTLLDFGIAAGPAIDPDLSGMLAGLGTPRYCAPEQLLGQSPDARSDLYSVGVMLFEALTGAIPHERHDRESFFAARVGEAAERIEDLYEDVPSTLAHALGRLLQRRPEDRPRSAAEALGLLRGRAPTGEDEPLRSLLRRSTSDRHPHSVDAMRRLFEGPDRLFHLGEDAGVELHRRTGGWETRVVEELGAWLRAGLASWTGDRLAVERDSLDRLRSGLRVVLPSHRPSSQGLSSDDEELLAWISLAGAGADATLLKRVTGRSQEALDADIDRLSSVGAVRRMAGDRLDPLVTPHLREVWESYNALQHAHRRLADAIPPGEAERLYHLVAGGAYDAVAEETLAAARLCMEEGRVGDATTRLAESLSFLRHRGRAEDEVRILTEWCKVALATFTPRAFDRVLYELSQSAAEGLDVGQLEALMRAAVLAIETDAERAFREASEVEPFHDPLLDRWRQAMRVYAAGVCSIEREERVLAEMEAWAAEQGDRESRATYLEARGRLRYRQERFAEAAESHAQAADLYERATGRLSATLNGASALLDALDPEGARSRAEKARELARSIRHAYFEARAEWILRAAGYRAGQPLTPDLELVRLMQRLGNIGLEAIVLLTEAAIAWRAGELGVARHLAAAAGRSFAERDMPWQVRLARCLELVAGERPSSGEVRDLRNTAGCPFPLITAQLLGLAARIEAPASDTPPEVCRSLAGIPAERRGVRLEVLSVAEILGTGIGRRATIGGRP